MATTSARAASRKTDAFTAKTWCASLAQCATDSNLDFLVAVPIKTSLPLLINEFRVSPPLDSSSLDFINNLRSTFSKAGSRSQPVLLWLSSRANRDRCYFFSLISSIFGD